MKLWDVAEYAYTPMSTECLTLTEAMQPQLDEGWEPYAIEKIVHGYRVFYKRIYPFALPK